MAQTSDSNGTAVLQPGASQTVQVDTNMTVANQNPTNAGKFTITIGTENPQDNTIDAGASADFQTGGRKAVTVANTGSTVLQLSWS